MTTRFVGRSTVVIAAGALLLVLASCSTGSRTSGDPFAGRRRASAGSDEAGGDIRISVRNSNFNYATIYAVSPGRRRRLGRVDGNGQSDFRISWTAGNGIRFEIDILGGQRCTTRTISASSGMRLAVIIDSVPRPRRDGSMRLCDVERAR